MNRFFDNGYGVSVISTGYGRDEGLLELAVVKGDATDFDLCYYTPITDDVIGWLTAEDVERISAQVAALPKVEVEM